MTAPEESNAVATAVLSQLTEDQRALGTVVLRGFLYIGGDSTQLYTNETFRSWYELKTADILHHVKGAGNYLYYAMDLVWVRREATVTKCRIDHASLFAETDEVEMADDPAAGPRRPSYP